MSETTKTPDSLHRFLFEHASIRGEIVRLDSVWRSVLERHDYPPVLRKLMGELCAAAVLLAATLKLKGSLILQIHGQAAVKLLVVECTGELELRATAKWEGELPDVRLPELVGEGRFVITLDAKDGNQVYQGIVPLEGESVAGIMQAYMTRSEQLETQLHLVADEQGASGMLLQKMPERESHDADAWARITHLAATLTSDELLALPAPLLLRRLFHEEDIRFFEAQPVSFYCACSRENVASMLRMVGKDEVYSVLHEHGFVEVHCEFCNQRYVFDPVDVKAVFSEALAVQANETRH